MDPVNVPAKFDARSFTHSWDNSGYSENFGHLHIRTWSLFSKTFDELLFRWTLWIYRPNLKSVALPVPEIIAIGLELQFWGRGGRRGSGMIPFERVLVSSYRPRPSIVTFHLSLRVSEIVRRFCAPCQFFPTLPLVSPKFPHVPLRSDNSPEVLDLSLRIHTDNNTNQGL